MKLKIAVYTMVKNEATHVDRFAETTSEADLVVVTDTGSDDGTPDLLRDKGIEVHHARIIPWRFDHGTNTALFNVPADIDVCLKLDLDEVIHMNDGGSWRKEIEKCWKEDTTQLSYWYTWNWHVPGKVPGVRFRTNNIHTRGHYHWRHPGHAALTCMKKPKTAYTDNLEIHHYMVNKGRPNYLPLLQIGVAENKCPRTLYYLGREYAVRGMHDNAIPTLQEYLDHPESRWPAERASAMLLIAVAHELQHDYNESMAWFMRASSTLPASRDIWYEFLRMLVGKKDFAGGYWAGKKCLSYTERISGWPGQTQNAWYDHPFLFTALCAYEMGKPSEAKKLVTEALKINPGNDQSLKLRANL